MQCSAASLSRSIRVLSKIRVIREIRSVLPTPVVPFGVTS